MSVTRAYANHGRWIIECECGSAVECRTQPSDPVHAQIGQKKWRCLPPPGSDPGTPGFCGSTYTVLWPDTTRITRILDQRPRVSNRNWNPGEPIARLVAENVEHDCPVPTDEKGIE